MKELYLSYCGYGEKGETVEALAGMKDTLKILTLSGSSPADYERLGEFQKLEELYVNETEFDSEDFAAIAALSGLKIFSAVYTGIARIPDLSGMTSLVILDLSGSLGIRDYSNVATARSLTELSAHYSFFNDEAFASIAGMSTIEMLDLGSSWVKNIPDLSRMTSLKILDLSNCTYLENISNLKTVRNFKGEAASDCELDISLNEEQSLLRNALDFSVLDELDVDFNADKRYIKAQVSPINAENPAAVISIAENYRKAKIKPAGHIICLTNIPFEIAVTAGSGYVNPRIELQPVDAETGLDTTMVKIADGTYRVIPGANEFKVVVTATPENEVIQWNDENLAAAVRKALGKEKGADVLAGEAAAITEINLKNKKITDISDLIHMPALKELYLGNDWVDGNTMDDLSEDTFNRFSDISVIGNLVNLEKLDLTEVHTAENERIIEDFSPILSLPKLKTLSLDFCCYGSNGETIADLKPLAGSLRELSLAAMEATDYRSFEELTMLEYLDLYDTGFSEQDIPEISGLTGLTWLGLGANGMTRIPDLSAFTSLKALDMTNTSELSDFSNLRNMTGLTELDLGFTRVNDDVFGEIAQMPNIDTLDLQGTDITGIPDLSGMTSLKRLCLLCCWQLTDYSGLGTCTGLTELYISGPSTENAFTYIEQMTDLVVLGMGESDITRVPDLANLTSLKTLDLKNCYELQDISNISTCSQFYDPEITDCKVLLLTSKYKYDGAQYANRITTFRPLQGITAFMNANLRYVICKLSLKNDENPAVKIYVEDTRLAQLQEDNARILCLPGLPFYATVTACEGFDEKDIVLCEYNEHTSLDSDWEIIDEETIVVLPGSNYFRMILSAIPVSKNGTIILMCGSIVSGESRVDYYVPGEWTGELFTATGSALSISNALSEFTQSHPEGQINTLDFTYVSFSKEEGVAEEFIRALLGNSATRYIRTIVLPTGTDLSRFSSFADVTFIHPEDVVP